MATKMERSRLAELEHEAAEVAAIVGALDAVADAALGDGYGPDATDYEKRARNGLRPMIAAATAAAEALNRNLAAAAMENRGDGP